MTVRINKSAFNIREKLSELERPIGLKGSELMRAETAQEARDFVSAGRRNLIINGAMQVAQRATSVSSVTSNGIRTADRFFMAINTLGTWTIDQSTDSPNGFSNSLKLTCTTADASPAANDYIFIRQNIEAQNLQSLGYGTADAKTMTLSFWVKSNKTGSASVDSRQLDNSNKLWSATYSISSADTWEYKTLTIPGDTAGVIDNNNDTGLYIDWWLNTGSTYIGGTAATTWSTNAENRRNPSNLGVGGATSDYFAITGVQLEVGKNATEFEHRSYGEELALCQRYYYRVYGGRYEWRSSDYNTYRNGSLGSGSHPVTMRQAPTMGHNLTGNSTNTNPSNAASPVGAWSWYSWATGWGTSSSINSGTIANWGLDPTTNGWAGGIYYFSPSNYEHVTHMQISSQSYFEANAEL